jgi:hypothetical protein
MPSFITLGDFSFSKLCSAMRPEEKPWPPTSLGAVLTAGAAAATALPACAAFDTPGLSAVDRRVLDLWRRRAKLVAFCERLGEQIDATKAQMPRWARSGPKYRLARGEIKLPGELDPDSVGWPEVANLEQQPVDILGRIIARPNVEDLYAQFVKAAKVDRKQATPAFLQSLLAHGERVKEQEAEQERTGYSRLNARQEAAANKIVDLNDAIEKKADISILAPAAHMMIRIELDDDEEDVLCTFRASLSAIRPNSSAPLLTMPAACWRGKTGRRAHDRRPGPPHRLRLDPDSRRLPCRAFVGWRRRIGRRSRPGGHRAPPAGLRRIHGSLGPDERVRSL